VVSNKQFLDSLRDHGVDFFCGVPDSLLKNFCAYLNSHTDSSEHIITANEGAAVGLAAGYHISTGKLPLVYLQNSGLGNTINPLLSLADPEVYSIPMILMIGWRGEPGVADEPQHRKQGRVQNTMLDAMEVPYYVLSSETGDISDFTAIVTGKAREISGPLAIVVKKNTFEEYSSVERDENDYELSREGAIHHILDKLSEKDIVVSTTGKPSREVYEYRVAKGQGHQNDFLTVGSMGHMSQIALGIALHTDRKVICLDGDGSLIMHMGSLCVNGSNAPGNFKHIVLNNGAHDSVGGQPTLGFEISIPEIAKACGYKKVYLAENESELESRIDDFLKSNGPSLLEIRVKKGARSDLGRPDSTPVQNKIDLMKFLNSE
jgi:phosphonopyruvate decarboxylase